MKLRKNDAGTDVSRFVSFLVKFKWLGLIGLLGSFSGNVFFIEPERIFKKMLEMKSNPSAVLCPSGLFCGAFKISKKET